MRIISGTARGRKLRAPDGLGTRPTPDRVREALFSVLFGRVEDARVLDLFAGTGALGLEALSRGAANATFVEHGRQALDCLRANVQMLGTAGARAEILASSAERALVLMAKTNRRFDLVFLDPPYDSDLLPFAITELCKRRLPGHGAEYLTPSVTPSASPHSSAHLSACLLARGAVVVCEHRSTANRPVAPEGLEFLETRPYGEVAISLYEYTDGYSANGSSEGGPSP